MSANITGVGGSIDLGNGAATSDEGLSLQWAAIKHDGDRRRWRGMHSLHADKSGTITVNLLKTSPTNAKLSVMYNAQSLSSATRGNNVIVIRNKSSNDVTTARGVAFKKLPDWQNAKDGNTVARVFDCIKIDQLLGTF